MMEPSIDELLKNCEGNRYTLVQTLTRRILELSSDKDKILLEGEKLNPVRQALKEVAEGKLTYKIPDKELRKK